MKYNFCLYHVEGLLLVKYLSAEIFHIYGERELQFLAFPYALQIVFNLRLATVQICLYQKIILINHMLAAIMEPPQDLRDYFSVRNMDTTIVICFGFSSKFS